MVRASHIAVVPDLRPAKPETERPSSVSCLLYSVFCLLSSAFCLSGCGEPQDKAPVWEKVKIGDLAPYDGGKKPQTQAIKTINLEVHVFEVPADNIEKLDRIRKTFYVKPLRLRDYASFTADSFLVRFGQNERWREIQDLVLAADGQRIALLSLILPDAIAQTLAIVGLDRPQSVFFTATDGSRQAANVGPGVLGLRIQAETIPGSRGQASVTAYPVFSLPTERAIPELDARAKLREFPFTTAAFGLNMGPGDFVYLGPKEYLSDQTTLGGLFFSNPKGRLFFSKTKSPEFKPAVRVFLILCTGLNY
jgi:hypothetical protein